MTRARWLLVSKPLRAPFGDGSSVLVRDLLAAMTPGRAMVYFGDPRAPIRDGPSDEIIPRPPMGHAPSMWAKLSVLTALAHPSRRSLGLHFFFTPNAVTSRVVRALRMMTGSRPVLQSVMSSDGVERMVPHLRDLDAVVVASTHTRDRLIAAGLDEQKVTRIYPGIPPQRPLEVEKRRALLYAGDLDLSTARRLIACARALDALPSDDAKRWHLVIACRPKGAEDGAARAEIRAALADALARGTVELHGRVDDFNGLVQRSMCQLFLADHVRKKVDLPLALLEGLGAGLGLIALDFAPLNEIFDVADARDLRVGARIPLDESAEATARAVVAALPDDATAQRWARDGRALIASDFSAEGLAQAYEKLYGRFDERHR